jgi:PhzF family phenazine biosynthesis protein
MGLPLYQVDAFTKTSFCGNPAAVCVLPVFLESDQLQAIAQEMNLSETAFVVPTAAGFDLRWFTPVAEVDLCGHATLAAAHALWQHQGAVGDLLFHTRSGTLVARQAEDWIALDFPQQPVHSLEHPKLLETLTAALGISPVWLGQTASDLFVVLDNETLVQQLSPDFAQIATLPCRGVIVTALSHAQDYDFVSRFFAPQLGIPEDPVTGSAHCSLYPYWREHVAKETLVGYQASRRGGIVKVQGAGDRVILFGQAVTVLQGELLGLD